MRFAALLLTLFSVANLRADGETERLPANPTAADLGLRAFSVVESQMRLATERENTSWSSQPGAIRTFELDGDRSTIYKLYSAPHLVASNAANLRADLPTDWDQKPLQFVDLNEPSVEAGELVFPIVDPRLFDARGESGNTPEGFSYRDGISGVVLPTPGDPDQAAQRLPMPVQWIYLLQDGTRGYVDGTGRFLSSPIGTEPTAQNPIVGRVAFWTDDHSSKIDINSASEGVYWDHPRADTAEEREFAKTQPDQFEYQRHIGHPASVCLSTVFYPHQRIGTPVGGSGEMQPLPLEEAERLWRIGNGIGIGGSRAGTLDISTRAGRMIATPMFYSPYLSLSDVTSRIREQDNGPLTPEIAKRLRRSDFLLATETESPEITLRGRPRISVWPLPSSGVGEDLTEQAFREASTVGNHSYHLRRSGSGGSRHNEWYNQGNNALQEYLLAEIQREVPGYGKSLGRKYGSGPYSDSAQITVMMLDFIRQTNLTRSRYSSGNDAGSGQVSGSCDCGGSIAHGTVWDQVFRPYPLGIGRLFTIGEVALVFHVTGWRAKDGSGAGEFEDLAPGQKSVSAGFVASAFSPSNGRPLIRPNMRIALSGRSRSVDETAPIMINGQSLGALAGELRSLKAHADPVAGGNAGITLFSDASDNAHGIAWAGSAVLPIDATTMSFAGNASPFRLLVYASAGSSDTFAYQVINLTFPDIESLPCPEIIEPVSWPMRLERRELIQKTDTVRSLVVPHGDHRLIAGTRAVGSRQFTPHSLYSDPTEHHAHSLFGQIGATYNSTLVPEADYAHGFAPRLTRAADDPQFAPGVPADYSYSTDPVVTGDFDVGLSNHPDGPYINGSTESEFISGGVPYFDPIPSFVPQIESLFVRHHVQPGPVTFGALPSGVRAGIPWRTLLFRPDPQHFGSSGAPDHLWLDHFKMPAPLPYTSRISGQRPGVKADAFSQQGRVNLNHRIVPFSHIERSTAVRAVLKSEKIIAIPTSAAGEYKSPGGATSYRHFIDMDETLEQWEHKFADGDLFRSSSEICEMYLVPEGQQLGERVAGDYPDMQEFWALHRLTGDNLKERPYTALHQHFTTQSNLYKIHVIAQGITKSDSTEVPHNHFNPQFDRVGSEYRGSATLRRHLDPRDPRIPNYLSGGQHPPLTKLYDYNLSKIEPELPVERFAIQSVALGENEIRLTWRSVPGVVYDIQISPDLERWQNLAEGIRGTAETTSYVHRSLVVLSEEKAYFRVVAR